ncbi:MAG: hypothetical protein HYS25_11520 [Ignavibacteriales bacterium]|nr:hypothetical protein [Ignavibacteriales bacterium]
MNKKREHIIPKSLKAAVLLIQLVFTFGFSFAQNSFDKCCHPKQEIVKHHCCAEAETPQIIENCSLDYTSLLQKISQCNCIHKNFTVNNDQTSLKNFELTKITAVEFVDYFVHVNNGIIYQAVNDISYKTHSPPIYLIGSTFLI